MSTAAVRAIGTGSLMVAVCLAACGGSTGSGTSMKHRLHPATGGSLSPASRILAGSSGVALGNVSQPLVVIPGFGKLIASCSRTTGRLSTRFVLAPEVPSNASIVVSSTPGARVRGTDSERFLRAPVGRSGAVAQTWQITPFSSAYIEVATIWITAQPTAAAFGHQGCVAGAQATVSTSTR